MFKRMAQKRLQSRTGAIDTKRLSLFDFEDGEKPIDTVACWMPLAFAATFGISKDVSFVSIPPDGAFGLSRDEWFDEEASDTRAQVFGLGTVAMAHVLVCVTDRRLIWLPLDTDALSPTSKYATFTTTELGARAIELSSIIHAEPMNSKRGVPNLAGGFSSSLYIRCELTSDSPFAGPAYPIWSPSLIPGWTSEGAELQFWVSDQMEMLADLLAVALRYVGVPIKPEEYGNVVSSKRPSWKPAYLKYPELLLEVVRDPEAQ